MSHCVSKRCAAAQLAEEAVRLGIIAGVCVAHWHTWHYRCHGRPLEQEDAARAQRVDPAVVGLQPQGTVRFDPGGDAF